MSGETKDAADFPQQDLQALAADVELLLVGAARLRRGMVSLQRFASQAHVQQQTVAEWLQEYDGASDV